MAPSCPRTILVAEDEPVVRNVVVAILDHADYQVLEADSASEALTAAHLFDGVIDLLITDHLLKTISGRQLAEQLRQARPSLKVLHISAYPEEHLQKEGWLMPGADFLGKPFTAQTLSEKVKQIIGSASDQTGS